MTRARRVHAGDLLLHELEGGDGLAPLHALLRVADALLEAAVDDAEAHRRHAEALALERRLGRGARVRRRPRRRGAGRRGRSTSSRNTSPVGEVCIPIFFIGGPRSPARSAPRSTRKARTSPLGPSIARVDDEDVGERRVGDERLRPERRQPPSTWRARVCHRAERVAARRPARSAPRRRSSPSSCTGSAKRSFCSAVPRARMAPPQSPSDAPNASAKPGQKRESSIIRMAMSGPSPPRRRLASRRPRRAVRRPRVFAKAARTMSAMPNVAHELAHQRVGRRLAVLEVGHRRGRGAWCTTRG